MTEFDSARTFWDSEVRQPIHIAWMAHPLVREYINESIAGGWPLDWLQKTYPARRFPRALSIGCGTGALERDLLSRGLCEFIEGIDASEVSLAIAREEAAKSGLSDSVSYRIADFNELSLPADHYDAVFLNQALHHVSRMERLLTQVRRSIRAGGILYLDEFIGPSRTYWTRRRIAWYQAIHALLPREIRLFDSIDLPVQYDDRSEAIRSGEIESRLRIGFSIRHLRGYGGNLLAVLFSTLAPPPPDAMVAAMIRAEKALLKSGVEPFLAVIVAEPKRGLAGAASDLRYFFSPKIRRVAREIRKRLGSPEDHASEERRFQI